MDESYYGEGLTSRYAQTEVTRLAKRQTFDWIFMISFRKVTKQHPRVLINIHEHTLAVVGCLYTGSTQFMMGLIQSVFAAEGGYHVHAVSATFTAVKYTVWVILAFNYTSSLMNQQLQGLIKYDLKVCQTCPYVTALNNSKSSDFLEFYF